MGQFLLFSVSLDLVGECAQLSRSSFITVPFQNRDAKAIEIVQIILETILLRREKSMKDRDGNPIVPLPPKTIIEERLTFKDAEREIYQRIYKDARSQFLGYKAEGNVMKNVTAIFAVLMRLRQAVLHPALVLNSITNRSDASGAMTTEDKEIKKMIVKYCSQGPGAKADSNTLIEELGKETKQSCLWCDSVGWPLHGISSLQSAFRTWSLL